MEFLTLILYITPIVFLLYIYINRKYSFWSDRGISGPKNIYPFGYLLSRFGSDPFAFELEHAKKYGKVYGLYSGTIPTLSISDVELVKTVLVKDFHLFINRRKFEFLDRYWSKSLFTVESDDWKRIRSIITPAFTSGKLRKMFPLLKQSTDNLIKYLDEVAESSNDSFHVKNVISGFTIDVIAATAFGTDTDSNGDRSKFNPFLHHGLRMFSDISKFRIIMAFSLPRSLLELLNIQHAFPYDSFDFLVNVIKTMIGRDRNRDDLITLLKEANVREDDLTNLNYNKLKATSDLENENSAKKDENTTQKSMKFLTDDEIVGQCILFFIAGFETTASAITHTLYELALNPEAQDRLYHDVTEKLSDADPNQIGEYYDIVCNKIPYLEAVIKETLRKYPPVTRLERRLSADNYKLGGIPMEKDCLVEIAPIAVHYDPDNYPEPFKYMPERFLPENKDKLVPYSYIPFGDGPRNCVGMRFAYQEAKICLAALIQKFTFQPNDKTPSKLEFPKSKGVLIANEFELTIKSRA